MVDPIKLRVPIFGNLFKKVAISRFSRNLGTMLQSGVPILQSLEIVGDTSGNIVIRNAAEAVEESVRRGESLAGPLAEHSVFPAMVVQMLAVGEDTGEGGDDERWQEGGEHHEADGARVVVQVERHPAACRERGHVGDTRQDRRRPQRPKTPMLNG